MHLKARGIFVNYPIVFKILSIITAIVTGAFGLCLAVSVFYSENAIEAGAYEPWITSFAVAAVMSLIFYLPGRNASTKIFKKEAMCVVGLAWIVCSLVGACPYVLILNCGFADAFFESASGLTSTGASVFGDLENFPKSILFWRSLSHWIGGLGVVVLFVAMLSSLGAGAKVIYSRESSLNISDFQFGKIIAATRRVIIIYFGLSILCASSYFACGMPLFDSICHMMATVSTGGFSVKNSSLGAYNSLSIEWVAIIFMFIGGTNFAIIFMAIKGRFREILKNSEFKAYVLIITLVSAGIFFSILNYDSVGLKSAFEAFTDSVFQVVSVITSTGFVTADYQKWAPVTHVLIFFLLIVGACSGSTAGGLKIFRLVGIVKISLNDIVKSFRPNLIRPVRLNAKVLTERNSGDMLSFTVLYAIVSMSGIIILSALERDLSFASTMATVVSCISNVGPGLAETGPVENYGFFNDASKLLLSLLMIMGRLEFYAVLALFMPSLWKRFR